MKEEVRAAAEALAATAARPLPFRPTFQPLAARPAGSVVAVDGSSAILADNGSVWVVAHRAAATRWPGPRPPELPATVTAKTPQEAALLIDRLAEGRGLAAPDARSADAFAAALRSFAEHDAAVQAIAAMPPGSLLLLDGALEGLPAPAQESADALRAAARARGVRVVGVAKRSGLSDGGVPFVPALQREGPPGAWAVALPDRPGCLVARLHARASHAFRVDAADLADVERLLPLCRDAAYLGYPYPLAVAHNAVALTGAHVTDLKARLRDGVRRLGSKGAADLVADFHDVLDRNVPG